MLSIHGFLIQRAHLMNRPHRASEVVKLWSHIEQFRNVWRHADRVLLVAVSPNSCPSCVKLLLLPIIGVVRIQRRQWINSAFIAIFEGEVLKAFYLIHCRIIFGQLTVPGRC